MLAATSTTVQVRRQQPRRRTEAAAKTTANAAALWNALPRAIALYAAFSFGMLVQYASDQLPNMEEGDGGLEKFGIFPIDRRLASSARTAAAAGDMKESSVGHGGGGVASSGESDEGDFEGRDIRKKEGVTWSEVREDLFDRYEYCKFPGFVVEDKPKVYLAKGQTFTNEWREVEREAARTRDDEERKKFVMERLKRRRRMRARQKNVKKKDGHVRLEREITYIHVGKAGGSSSSCHIREAFPVVKKHCGTRHFPAEGPGESAISRQVNCYTHYNDYMHCYDVNDSFIINTRNPVHRIASWYLYEHAWNEPWNNPSRSRSNPRCGVYMVSTCFDSLDELATVGLSGPSPPRGGEGFHPLRVGSDLTREECSRWAWAAVRGDVPANYHNVWNYDWYAHRLFEDESKEVFNLRVEHVDEDWRKIDRMVGGTGDPLPDVDTPRNDASAKVHLPVTNRTVSEEGRLNLCRALCEEIQIYKRLLVRAVNLNDEDVRESMEELRKTCPDETDVQPRDCGQ